MQCKNLFYQIKLRLLCGVNSMDRNNVKKETVISTLWLPLKNETISQTVHDKNVDGLFIFFTCSIYFLFHFQSIAVLNIEQFLHFANFRYFFLLVYIYEYIFLIQDLKPVLNSLKHQIHSA